MDSGHPPASEASREVANLTERKNLHTPEYGVKEFFLLSCLSVVNFDPNYLRTSRTEWADIFLGHLRKNECSQKFYFISTKLNTESIF